MKPQSLLFSEMLKWSKVPRKRPRTYELSQGDKAYAHLTWQKFGGSQAIGESPAGNFSLKRVGFFATRVSIRTTDSDSEIGYFYPGMLGGGRIEMRDGRSWKIKATGLFQARYDITDQNDRLVLNLKIKGFGSGAEILFSEPYPDEKTAYMLAIISWYVSILASEDASAVTAIVCCSGAVL